MTYRISVIEGDGIGPHIVGLTKQLLSFLADEYGFTLEFLDAPAGDKVEKETGEALPKETLNKILSSDACLKGPVGETARDVIVFLRQKLDLYANIRPFKTYRGVKSRWDNVDFVIVRENTEDLYKSIEDVDEEHGVALLVITHKATERIARVAFNMAMQRRKKVTIVHKANVLRSYQLFRKTAYEIAEGFKEVKVDDMYVDNAAYQMIINPQTFDVILTPNLFGDILSDEAAGVAGTIGIAGSANIGENYGLFEPVHGSAPTLDPETANPIAQITAAKMMLEWLGEKKNNKNLKQASQILSKAVENILNEGKILTPDLGGKYKCSQFIDELKKEIERLGK
ncbi:MAG TPA: isocitrate/isopropylmalate dehydrogenase family protein [Candidatus Caldiarchaeum subterraneum]|uniref:Isocitrate/isopropylmalate dehydrogenase family protein n=1 Tax=Caldiarchaeum subterraneum TaxID=311458 RepID=A0A833ED26_CALS0|nr:isocitrate/isopropylmalate dehydrogenase family protein [Candidatus Caldarchaeum subterraneum]